MGQRIVFQYNPFLYLRKKPSDPSRYPQLATLIIRVEMKVSVTGPVYVRLNERSDCLYSGPIFEGRLGAIYAHKKGGRFGLPEGLPHLLERIQAVVSQEENRHTTRVHDSKVKRP